MSCTVIPPDPRYGLGACSWNASSVVVPCLGTAASNPPLTLPTPPALLLCPPLSTVAATAPAPAPTATCSGGLSRGDSTPPARIAVLGGGGSRAADDNDDNEDDDDDGGGGDCVFLLGLVEDEDGDGGDVLVLPLVPLLIRALVFRRRRLLAPSLLAPSWAFHPTFNLCKKDFCSEGEGNRFVGQTIIIIHPMCC